MRASDADETMQQIVDAGGLDFGTVEAEESLRLGLADLVKRLVERQNGGQVKLLPRRLEVGPARTPCQQRVERRSRPPHPSGVDIQLGQAGPLYSHLLEEWVERTKTGSGGRRDGQESADGAVEALPRRRTQSACAEPARPDQSARGRDNAGETGMRERGLRR